MRATPTRGASCRPLWTRALLAAVVLTGCRSRDPALYDRRGLAVEDTEPLAYRIAVAPLEVADSIEKSSRLSPALRTEKDLQEELVNALIDLKTASDIFSVSAQTSYDAYAEQADLLLVPRLDEASFRRSGTTGRAFLSSALWLTTWISSLWVEDTSYDARLVLRYDIVDPHTGIDLFKNVEARSKSVDLSFWDRNEAFSSSFFLSLLVPPFLTQDNDEMTSRALTRRAATLAAAELKNYLGENLASRQMELLAHIEVKGPRNGSRTSGPTPLHCDVHARRVITEVVVLVNDEERLRLAETDLPGAGEQSRTHYFYHAVHLDDVGLKEKGKNIVRILVNVAGQWASRSIAIYRE
ncbi:MAG TPA: hypothetical protein VMT52_18070 [Planctomycetota bacterium]|nr:hypothetical protein [Planctomycetota bacterium]